jgi:outer membrane protein assembly factor BamB
MYLTIRSYLRNFLLGTVIFTVLFVTVFAAIPLTFGDIGSRPATDDFLNGDLLIAYAPYNETWMAYDPCRIVHYGYDVSYIQTIAQVDSPKWDAETVCFAGMTFDWDGNLFVVEKRLQIGTEVGAVAVISGPTSPHEFMYRFNIPSPYYAPRTLVFDRTYSFLADRPLWNLYVGCEHDRTQIWGDGPIIKFAHSGDLLNIYEAENEGPNFATGASWIELNQTDQETIVYASGFQRILRYNVAGDVQLPDFAFLPEGFTAHDVRILPDGTILVAAGSSIRRFDNFGDEIGPIYDVPDEGAWCRLALDIDGQSFYAGSGGTPTCGGGTGKVYKFDIETGDLLMTIDMECPSGYGAISGLAVYQEVECEGVLEPLVPVDAFGRFHCVHNVQGVIKNVKTLNVKNINSLEISYNSPLTVTGQLEDPMETGSFTLEVEKFIPDRGTNTTKLFYYVTINPHPRTDCWPMFRHDSLHRGHSTSTSPTANSTRWNCSTSGSIVSSPAVTDGKVFFGSANSTYALNETTGRIIWQQPFAMSSSPAVADGAVFFGSGPAVYAVNGTDGSPIWRFLTTAPVQSSPTIACGKIFFGCDNNRVYALNKTDKNLLWSFSTDTVVRSSPALADGVVFVGSDTKLYALNETDGSLIWDYIRNIRSSPTVADGLVFFGSTGGVYALNVTTGSSEWRTSTGGDAQPSPAVANGIVVLGCDDNQVYALNETDGDIIWNYSTQDNVESSPAIADGKVFIGSHDNSLYALNESNGQLLWKYATGGDVLSSPAVAYGNVFVGSGDGKLYALGPYYDVAVSLIQNSKTVVGQGYPLRINVTVTNLGDVTETSQLSLRYNGLIDGLQVTLDAYSSTIVEILWNTAEAEKNNYTMMASIVAVPGETDTADNTLVDGWVIVTVPGDVDGDFDVDIYDVVRTCTCYGFEQGEPEYIAECDIDSDGDVDIYDVVILCNHYGETYP